MCVRQIINNINQNQTYCKYLFVIVFENRYIIFFHHITVNFVFLIFPYNHVRLQWTPLRFFTDILNKA